MRQPEPCGTISEALGSITSVEEMAGFTAALRNPNLRTMPTTTEEQRKIALRKIQLTKEAKDEYWR